MSLLEFFFCDHFDRIFKAVDRRPSVQFVCLLNRISRCLIFSGINQGYVCLIASETTWNNNDSPNTEKCNPSLNNSSIFAPYFSNLSNASANPTPNSRATFSAATAYFSSSSYCNHSYWVHLTGQKLPFSRENHRPRSRCSYFSRLRSLASTKSFASFLQSSRSLFSWTCLHRMDV